MVEYYKAGFAMFKLDYFGPKQGERDAARPNADHKWPFILVLSGLFVLVMVDIVWSEFLVSSRAAADPVADFGKMLVIVALAAVAEIICGGLAAKFNDLDIGPGEISTRKLLGVSVLCTALSIPFGAVCMGVAAVFAVAPIRYVLLRDLFGWTNGEAIAFTSTLTVMLLLVGVVVGIPHRV
jgi:hypothetical protein